MTSDTFRTALLVSMASSLVVFVTQGFIFRVSGRWRRFDDDEVRLKGLVPAEEITLLQFGPLIFGRSLVPGGHHSFTGYLWLRRLHLWRRDHGHMLFTRQGFPDVIARRLDGGVTAHLLLDVDSTQLIGSFVPKKFSFTHRPPAITSVETMPGQQRGYRRVVPILSTGEAARQLFSKSRISDSVEHQPAHQLRRQKKPQAWTCGF